MHRDHLFFECSFSEKVWRGMIRGLAGTGSFARWPFLLQRLMIGLQDKISTFLFFYCLQVVVYEVWYERNTRRMGEAPQPAARLLIFLDKLVRNKISSLRKKTGNKYDKAMEIWLGSR